MRWSQVTVKKFKQGQEAFVLYMYQGRNREPEIYKRIVEKVGRKYVTDNRGNRYCKEQYLAEGLVEYADCGERGHLFLTEEEAKDYIEKYNLARWLSNISFSDSRRYSLWKLRKVKEILGD